MRGGERAVWPRACRDYHLMVWLRESGVCWTRVAQRQGRPTGAVRPGERRASVHLCVRCATSANKHNRVGTHRRAADGAGVRDWKPVGQALDKHARRSPHRPAGGIVFRRGQVTPLSRRRQRCTPVAQQCVELSRRQPKVFSHSKRPTTVFAQRRRRRRRESERPVGGHRISSVAESDNADDAVTSAATAAPVDDDGD
uniref:Uncharacterized protein n=1 Tax=Plectus sambesii TaxID=2011161 RepID=A0A914VI53_9BILA